MTESDRSLDPVFQSPDRQACTEHALVLRAVGINCVVRPGAEGFALFVPARFADRARAELDAYALENVESSPGEIDVTPRTDGWAGVMSYVSIVLLAAVCAERNLLDADWYGAGKTSALLIRDGQWWRTFTALTLHADRPHLIGNVVIGGLFGLFAARLVGSGLAWLAILSGGAAGNFLNAWMRPDGHTSVGASTAIFAALGMISAWAWTQRRSDRLFSLARWTPLVSGAVLLGWLGTGGGRTDVNAHVAGFAAGIVLGVVIGRLDLRSRLAGYWQAYLAVAALFILVTAWTIALVVDGNR